MTTLSQVQERISEVCDEVKEMLLEKNRKYGNSAIEPKRIFSKLDAVDTILVRIDDKLSRIMMGGFDPALDKDTLFDLIGYLILLKVAMRLEDAESKDTTF